jgi:gas vesicle protein
MDTQTKDPRDHRLAIGFLLGTAVGAGLMMWLAPRAASELRQRVTESAKNLRQRAQGVRDDVAETVVRGAREVERYAAAAKTDRVA